MAHVNIKNNSQAHNRPTTIAAPKGSITSGAPHIAKHHIGSKGMNKSNPSY